MYEYTCAYCGKVTQVERRNGLQIYCSKSCAAKARNERRVKIDRPTNGECIYQPESINCDRRKCSTCGWNPDVAKARLEAFIENPICEPKPAPQVEIKTYCADWIPVDESMPEDCVQVLAYTDTGRVMSLHCEDGMWRKRDNICITHWMPMPKGPKP